MAATKVTSKPTTYVTSKGLSIDGYDGPWNGTEEFETFWSTTLGHTDPITNGITIRVVDGSGKTTIYKRSEDQWVEVGAGKVSASDVEYNSGNEYPEGTIGNVIKNIENNTGADKFPEGTTTAFDAHGLEKGSDISGMTPYQVLDKILNAEFAPRWTDATAKLSIGTTLYEVGASVPSEESFTPTGNPASAQGYTTAKGGSVKSNELLVDTNTLGIDDASVTFGDEVAKRGMLEIELTRTYEVGTTEVVTSKNRKTKKTAYNLTTRWDVPSENTSIDDNYYIKEDEVTTDTDDCAKIYFCMPVWIDGNKQTLAYSQAEYTKEKNLASDTNHKITFEIPSSYTGVSVAYYDSVNRTWVDVDLGTPVAETKTLGTQTYDYSKYTYTDSGLGKVTYRLKFTIA